MRGMGLSVLRQPPDVGESEKKEEEKKDDDDDHDDRDGGAGGGADDDEDAVAADDGHDGGIEPDRPQAGHARTSKACENRTLEGVGGRVGRQGKGQAELLLQSGH